MDINKNTKLTEILNEYPWLPDELIKLDSRFKIVKTPVGKMMIKNATVADLTDKTGLSEDQIKSHLQKLVEEHGNQN